MSTYTNSRSSNSTASPDNTSTEIDDQQRTELSEVRQRLFDIYEYVRDDDPELYQEINRWLRASISIPDGSVGEAVNSRLRELKRGNKMRDHRGVDDPSEAFHDDCEGCPHYGVSCPMVKGYRCKKTINRVLETANSDEEVIEELSDLAIEKDCHVVLEELDDYQNSHAEFLKEGYRLNSRAVAVLSDESNENADLDETGMTAEFSEPDSPPPEVEKRIEATASALMNDEEDMDE